jgi:hypothetical protein
LVRVYGIFAWNAVRREELWKDTKKDRVIEMKKLASNVKRTIKEQGGRKSACRLQECRILFVKKVIMIIINSHFI